eukprot:COSAG02_NODE_12325_length_1561_cov_25.880723_2_plen_247_part_00
MQSLIDTVWLHAGCRSWVPWRSQRLFGAYPRCRCGSSAGRSGCGSRDGELLFDALSLSVYACVGVRQPEPVCACVCACSRARFHARVDSCTTCLHRCKKSHPCIVDLFYRLFGTKIVMYGAVPKPEPVYFIANHQHYHVSLLLQSRGNDCSRARLVRQVSSPFAAQDNVTLISAMAARVAGVGGAGLRWMAKRSLMVQPLGWSMYCSGEVMLSRQYDKDQKKIAEAVRGLPAEKTSWLVRWLPLKL